LGSADFTTSDRKLSNDVALAAQSSATICDFDGDDEQTIWALLICSKRSKRRTPLFKTELLFRRKLVLEQLVQFNKL
jgi:hypothetical protein